MHNLKMSANITKLHYGVYNICYIETGFANLSDAYANEKAFCSFSTLLPFRFLIIVLHFIGLLVLKKYYTKKKHQKSSLFYFFKIGRASCRERVKISVLAA